jgi:hypothetical protein
LNANQKQSFLIQLLHEHTIQKYFLITREAIFQQMKRKITVEIP